MYLQDESQKSLRIHGEQKKYKTTGDKHPKLYIKKKKWSLESLAADIDFWQHCKGYSRKWWALETKEDSLRTTQDNDANY